VKTSANDEPDTAMPDASPRFRLPNQAASSPMTAMFPPPLAMPVNPRHTDTERKWSARPVPIMPIPANPRLTNTTSLVPYRVESAPPTITKIR